MSEPRDGGPAFPVTGIGDRDYHPGLSLRDYFAGQALPEAIRYALDLQRESINRAAFDFDRVCVSAYQLADAMLKAREAK